MGKKAKPGFLWSMFTHKCPRCRRGKLFKDYSPYNFKHTFNMHDECQVCGQKTELEPGFWYGTGYVSYALTVALSVISFILWWIIIGISVYDNSLFWWLGFNAVLLIALQPLLMRLSRTIYLNFFVKYDEDFEDNPIKEFDY